MNAIELMRSWPGLSTAKPSELLASPAWRLETEFEGVSATLHVAEEPTEELFLSVTLDEVPHVLGLSRTGLYPDLEVLWDRRAQLPGPLLIALVEKECGGVLQFIENLVRQEVQLKGVAAEKGVARRTAFSLTGRSASFGFSLDLPSGTIAELGVLENLDPRHTALLSLTRETRGVYRLFGSVDRADLKAGDYLILDNAAAKATPPYWETALPEDGAVRIVLAAPRTFTFADFADDALSALPQLGSEPLALYAGATPCFAAVPARVGDAAALKLEPLAA